MTKSYSDLFREARAEVREVTPRQADALRSDPGPPCSWMSARPTNGSRGTSPARCSSRRATALEQEIESKAADRARPMVVYCAGGIRSVFAVRALQEMGYAAAVSMSGGSPSGARSACRRFGRPA